MNARMLGLSPRARGNLRSMSVNERTSLSGSIPACTGEPAPALRKGESSRNGSIPACTGEPAADRPGSLRTPDTGVYPRVHGGTSRTTPSGDRRRRRVYPRVHGGTSHLRGDGCPPLLWVYPRVHGGTYRDDYDQERSQCAVYPRVHGGTCAGPSRVCKRTAASGLSPRARGNPIATASSHVVVLTVYPRVHGGTCHLS